MKNFSFYHPNHCNSYKIGMVVHFFIILSNVVHNGLMNWVLGGLGIFSFNIIMKFPLKKIKSSDKDECSCSITDQSPNHCR